MLGQRVSTVGGPRRPSNLGHRGGRAALLGVAGVLAAGALGVVPAAAGAAGPLVLFVASYNDCVVYGAGPARTAIRVTWKDADGTVKHLQTVKSRANGQFQTTCDGDERVERGDVFIARIGSRSRTFTVPPLSIRIDRETDEVAGRAPDRPDSTVTLTLPDPVGEVSTATGPDGSFAYDATGDIDLLGADWVGVDYRSALGDVIMRWQQVPYVQVYRGRAVVHMVGRPGTVMEVDLERASVATASVRCTLGPTGNCSLSLTDDDGHPVKVLAGDVITSPQLSDASFAVPPIAVSATPSTDVIRGTCFTDRASPFWVQAYRPIGNGSVSRSGTTSAAGTFARDVTRSYDLRSGDKVALECSRITGDVVARFITVP